MRGHSTAWVAAGAAVIAVLLGSMWVLADDEAPDSVASVPTSVGASTSSTSSTSPATLGWQPQTTDPSTEADRGDSAIEPNVLVHMALGGAAGVAVDDAGNVYVAEPVRGRVLVRHPDGTVEVAVDGLTDPDGLAIGSDGEMYIGDGSEVLRIDAAGERHVVRLPGADVTAIAIGPDGALYLCDTAGHQVIRVTRDGAVSQVGPTGLGDIAGVAVDDQGRVYVVDVAANDVVYRTADGEQGEVGFTGLINPRAVAVHGGTVAVNQSGTIVVHDGVQQTERTDVQILYPGGITTGRDGTIYAASYADSGRPAPPSRSVNPGGVGKVWKLSLSGSTDVLNFGDLSAFGQIAAVGSDGVAYTSWEGTPAYSHLNPLRTVAVGEPPHDVDDREGWSMVAAAPDGTIYRSDYDSLVAITPDGDASPIPVPTTPELAAVVDVAVAPDGTLYVALGSGYGSGPFRVIELSRSGEATTRYEARENSASLLGIGAFDDVVVVAQITGGEKSVRLVDAAGDVAQPVKFYDGHVSDFTVDRNGTVYLIRYQDEVASIDVIATDGTVTPLSYRGQSRPVALSMGPDGTLHVADSRLGLVALVGVGVGADGGD